MTLKSSSKPLYQPWNEEAFQSDIFVRNMKPVERWMYRTLLQAMFFHSTRPFLPKDDNMLWMLAGCESREQWAAHKDIVLSMFVDVENEPELLQNKRVNEDWKRVQKKRKQYQAMGRASAEKRSTHVQPTSNVGSRREGKRSEGNLKGREALSAALPLTTELFVPEEV